MIKLKVSLYCPSWSSRGNGKRKLKKKEKKKYPRFAINVQRVGIAVATDWS